MTDPDATEDRNCRRASLSVVRPAFRRRGRQVRDLHQDHGRRFGHRLSTAMSISAPASAPRSGRSSPKNSTCPLRASSSCSAIPSLVPNQGATIASETIQITAVPLRKAAAQARQFLVARAAERLELAGRGSRRRRRPDPRQGQSQRQLRRIDRGRDHPARTGRRRSGESRRVPTRIVGQSVPRVDLPAKATGELVYVHDMRVPGMLHGRVVRPPYAGVDVGDFIGNSLIAVDEASVARYSRACRRRPDRRLRRRRRRARGECDQGGGAAQGDAGSRCRRCPISTDIETALRANPSTPRTLIDKGDVDAAIAGAAKPMPRTYVWPYQMHGSIGPSCAVADYQDGPDPGLVRHAEPAHAAHRSGAADPSPRSRDRRDPDGGRRLLRPQLRRRRLRRRGAAVARRRPRRSACS